MALAHFLFDLPISLSLLEVVNLIQRLPQLLLRPEKLDLKGGHTLAENLYLVTLVLQFARQLVVLKV